ncbi:IS5 family transposase [Singulisphaera sp. PoT]|uniref:IS5 family transposase n=1 Tax=Singulisphaera sp. PoT TaxID=3411797 RepID=UPI003BF568E3
MAKPLLPDALRDRIKPLLPPPPKPKRPDRPGRHRLGDRRAMIGILFVLKTGINWEDLPMEMGCGSGMTCWRRLDEWTRAGVWSKLHELLLAELEYAHKIDWSRAAVDSSHARARGGGERTGPSPVDRRKRGSKHHIVVDGKGTPLAATVTAGNYPDVKELEAVVDAVPPVRGKAGRPRRRPLVLYADRAYDSKRHRQQMRRRGIKPKFARRKTEHGSGLGVYRCVSERTLSWLHGMGRLRVRKDRKAAIHQEFLAIGCSIICFSQLAQNQLC